MGRLYQGALSRIPSAPNSRAFCASSMAVRVELDAAETITGARPAARETATLISFTRS